MRVKFSQTYKKNNFFIWGRLFSSSSLSKRVLQRGHFTSKDDLKQKLTAYMQYYNDKLAKQFKWSISKKKDVKELIEKVKRMVLKFAP